MELSPDHLSFLERCEEAKKMALSFKEPLIVHHYDADGVSAGAIVVGAFIAANHTYRRECIKKLDDEAIDRYLRDGEREIIFVDLGGGNKRVNELGEVVIIDHHQTEGIEKMQANPLLFGIDGGDELSASGTAYCVFRQHPELGIIGAIGDMMTPLRGMNRWVLEEGVKSGDIAIENDLRLYGRYCRPLVQFLAYCDDPYIPGISYKEEKAMELLLELRIPLEKKDGTKRVYADLNREEKTRVVSALVRLLSGSNRRSVDLVGESYILPKRPKDETFEANEFSTLLNACGRHGKPEIGIGVCLGDEKSYQEAQALLALHRKMLRDGVLFASSSIQDMGPFYFLDGRGVIDEGLIGVVCGMVMQQGWTKPLVGIALGENDTIKTSGRSPRALVNKGLNLGLMMKECSAKVGGVGGGHRIAAGSSIPKDKLDGFLLEAGRSISPIIGYKMDA